MRRSGSSSSAGTQGATELIAGAGTDACFIITSIIDVPSKGKRPARISKSTTPNA